MHGSLSISQHNLEMFEEKSELRLSMSFIIKHALKRKEGVCFPDRNWGAWYQDTVNDASFFKEYWFYSSVYL